MAEIIKPAQRVWEEKEVRLFEFCEDRSCGFQFDVIDRETLFLCDAAKKNF